MNQPGGKRLPVFFCQLTLLTLPWQCGSYFGADTAMQAVN